jgi:iron complex transport system substrate-binding protein
MVTGSNARRIRTAIVWIVALAAAAAASTSTMGATGAAVPARIVSTSPSITETLFALGLGDRVVGVSLYCWFPAGVGTLPKVGTFLRPDVEVIARLKPDLVFVHPGPHQTAAQLKQLGIAAATVDRGSLASVFATIRQIGASAGVPDRASELIATINRRLDQVKSRAAGRPPRKVLIIVGRSTGTLTDITAVGPGSYLHDVAALAGGVNVLSGTRLEYPRISLEAVIQLAPDVIVDVGEMGEFPDDAPERRARTARLWAGQTLVRAARDGRVHVVTDQAFVVPGPRIVNVAEAMVEWFHAR